MSILMIGDWLVSALATLFLSIIDGVFYWLLSVAYNIFTAVAELDLFGGGGAGLTLYNGITKRVYMILSVVMVFIFAYQLLMLIADPDGKQKTGSSQIVKDTLISIIMLILFPLLFRYMAMFQYHVLMDNTIPAIILGTTGTEANKNAGQNIAMMTFISFYHPEGTTYSTFFGDDGLVRDDAEDECETQMTNEGYGDNASETCEVFADELRDWSSAGKNKRLSSLMWNSKLKDTIGEGMAYSWILSTAAAIAVGWMFLCYSLDVGVRAVKLGVLQLVSPVPVILRIFPNTRKSFDKWVFHMEKTYIELFVRIAVIFFGLEIIKLIPTFIRIIFQSNDTVMADGFTKCVATVLLILGILRFCQDAPGLFKEIFDTGGGLFTGIDIKPGVKHRLEDNKTLMAGVNKALPMYASAKSEFGRQYQHNLSIANQNNPSNVNNNSTAFFQALPAGFSGLMKGARDKSNVTDLSYDTLHNEVANLGENYSRDFFEGPDGEYNQAMMDARANYVGNLTNTGETDSMTEGDAWKAYRGAVKAARHDRRALRRATRKEEQQEWEDRVYGNNIEAAISSDSLDKLSSSIKDILETTGYSKVGEEIKNLQKLIDRETNQDKKNLLLAQQRKEYEKQEEIAKKLMDPENKKVQQYMKTQLESINDILKNNTDLDDTTRGKLETTLQKISNVHTIDPTGKDLEDLNKELKEINNISNYVNGIKKQNDSIAEAQKKRFESRRRTPPSSGDKK